MANENEWDNVFMLWLKNGRKLPFRVSRWTWHPSTFFEVTEIKIRDKDWEYYREKGTLYGKAYGFFYISILEERNQNINKSFLVRDAISGK